MTYSYSAPRIFTLLALLLVCLQTACFGVAHADPIIVRVGGSLDFTIPDKNAPDPKTRADRAVIDEFEREHPNIRLVNANGLQIKGPAAESNLLMQFAGGVAPDVVYVNFRSMDNYIQQGFLLPLDSYLAQDPKLLQRVNPMIRKVITVDGHIYAYPYAQFVQALYYRKDLFQQAGLDPNKPPANWNEFYDDCKQITDQPHGLWGFEWPDTAPNEAYWWINLLWQAGGEVTVKNAKGQWVAAFDSPAGVEALEFYKHMVDDPYVSPIDGKTYKGVANQGNAQYAEDRARGKTAMWFGYQSNVIANTSDSTTINPSVVGIAPMPKGPRGQTANEINAAMWALSSQTKSGAVRDAAWQFIAFMGSDTADRIRTKAYVEAGLGFLINPASLVKYGYQDEAAAQSRQWLDANRTLFQHGHPEPYGANMQNVYQLLGLPLQAIALHPDANPHLLLADAARQVDDKLIGYTPPAVMHRRRVIAWTIFTALIALALSLTTWRMTRRPIVPLGGEAGLLSPDRMMLAGAASQAPAPGALDFGPHAAIPTIAQPKAASEAASPLLGAGGQSGSSASANGAGGQSGLPVAGQSGSQPVRLTGWANKRSTAMLAWLFMAPALLSILIWSYLPLGRGLVMAFQDYQIVKGAHWVGLDNFIDASLSYSFWIGIWNAIVYTVLTIVIGFLIPIFLAIMLNELPRGTLLFRFLFYLPAITASLVVNLLWGIFESGTPNGLFNQMIALMHLPPQNWLGDPRWALLGVVLPAVWSTAGPGCIIYLAAMKSIPTDFYEAADLDGASVWTKIRRITLPQLKPLIIIQLVGAVVAAFQVTDRILVMTGGGPLYATHTIGLEIWENAFLYLKFGYATAAAWMMGSLLIGFTVWQLRAMRNVRFAASAR